MDLTTGSIPKKVLRYTIPLVLTALIQLLFNAADLVVVGLYCGSSSVAAVGSTTSVVHLLIELFFGFAAGVSVTVAQARGAGDDEAVTDAVHTAIPLGTLCGVLLIAVGVPLSGTGLKLINTPSDILPQATLYMQIYFVGVLPEIVYDFGAAILHANGETRKPLVYLSASGVTNIILNVIFVVCFGLDVVGVALATAISKVLSCILVLADLTKRTDASRLVLKKMRFHRASLVKILKIGIPTGLQSSLYSVANVFVQSSINAFGTAAVAGNSAATSIGSFINAIVTNYGTTALNFAGQNFGAKKYDRIRKASNFSLFFSVASGIAASGLAILFAKPLLSIYITDSPEAIAYGFRKLVVAYSFYVFTGIAATSSGSMRGLGISIPPLVISIFCIGILRLVWLFVMQDLLGFHSINIIYLTYPVSWTAHAVCLFIGWQITIKKILVPLEEAQKKESAGALS